MRWSDDFSLPENGGHLEKSYGFQIRYKLPSKRNNKYEENTDIFNLRWEALLFPRRQRPFLIITLPVRIITIVPIHGFYLGLGSSSLAPSDSSSPSSLSGEIRLDSFTLRGAANNLGANVTYGFLVLNGSDNSVIGWSTNTGTTAAGINLTFSFSSLDGSPLLLDAALTYRFLAVSQSVMDLMQDTSKTYLYARGEQPPLLLTRKEIP